MIKCILEAGLTTKGYRIRIRAAVAGVTSLMSSPTQFQMRYQILEEKYQLLLKSYANYSFMMGRLMITWRKFKTNPKCCRYKNILGSSTEIWLIMKMTLEKKYSQVLLIAVHWMKLPLKQLEKI
jgi:hypothetical protein